MLTAAAVRLVEGCRRRARVVAALAFVLTALCAVYTAGRLGIDTDTGKLLSPDLRGGSRPPPSTAPSRKTPICW